MDIDVASISGGRVELDSASSRSQMDWEPASVSGSGMAAAGSMSQRAAGR